jgi:hypothetical protein
MKKIIIILAIIVIAIVAISLGGGKTSQPVEITEAAELSMQALAVHTLSQMLTYYRNDEQTEMYSKDPVIKGRLEARAAEIKTEHNIDVVYKIIESESGSTVKVMAKQNKEYFYCIELKNPEVLKRPNTNNEFDKNTGCSGAEVAVI